MFSKGTRKIYTKGHFCTRHFCMEVIFYTRVKKKNIYRKNTIKSKDELIKKHKQKNYQPRVKISKDKG